ncbi:Testis-expressed sequence 264 protein [Liparis tanakae]|uniref:Testis-expressed sequence 264 protein n=1 Tax=Liparis tanakae TaxID=230148 RepID=A0A4Z2J2I0_9TELE|nr:Testis-expressed sequence 264 protein [Liparis tanakae]
MLFILANLTYLLKERRLCAHPFLEIYREGLIHFMVPLARQGDFYVPEVRPAERRLILPSQFSSFVKPRLKLLMYSVEFSCPAPRRGREGPPHSGRDHQLTWAGPSALFGADSNSDCSSGSGVLLSDSRETSSAGSSVRSVVLQDQGDRRKHRGRGSRGASFEELDREPTGGRRAERGERLPRDSRKKSPPAQQWWERNSPRITTVDPSGRTSTWAVGCAAAVGRLAGRAVTGRHKLEST